MRPGSEHLSNNWPCLKSHSPSPSVRCLPGSHSWVSPVSPGQWPSDGSEERPWHATIIPARVRHLNWHPNKNWLALNSQHKQSIAEGDLSAKRWQGRWWSDIFSLIGDWLSGICGDVLTWSWSPGDIRHQLSGGQGADTICHPAWSSLPGNWGSSRLRTDNLQIAIFGDSQIHKQNKLISAALDCNEMHQLLAFI